ncbi:hypothetical protein BMS3Abin07_01747 [bacterium BMS3Abin07]|nr:hypothetical protein BMS3Abin07_01747 [bacterium BMS3Abin07]GBE32699.1 hypothetical protein BMS3Bbin05_01616 [bacterium BMS3Bbin05]HDO22091.1 hypothetical protein [Nitrospirota bacterium]
MNCWESMKCPPDTYNQCPAHPNRGLDCWKVTGTKCDQGRLEMASIADKITFCRKCSFYDTYAHKF